jgi:hypothetical protein
LTPYPLIDRTGREVGDTDFAPHPLSAVFTQGFVKSTKILFLFIGTSVA